MSLRTPSASAFSALRSAIHAQPMTNATPLLDRAIAELDSVAAAGTLNWLQGSLLDFYRAVKAQPKLATAGTSVFRDGRTVIVCRYFA